MLAGITVVSETVKTLGLYKDLYLFPHPLAVGGELCNLLYCLLRAVSAFRYGFCAFWLRFLNQLIKRNIKFMFRAAGTALTKGWRTVTGDVLIAQRRLLC